MNPPLLSIIIPVYNASRFLSRCLESMVRQTYTNLEVICVDDGSIDDSMAVLQQYAARDARIRIFHQKNAGVSSARNLGLKVASGKFVTFVDADDWVESVAYEKVMSQFTPETDIICMGVEIEGDMPEKQSHEIYFNSIPLKNQAVNPELFKFANLNLWNKVYRKSVIDMWQIRFPDSVAYGEDIAFVCCILGVSSHTTGISEKLYHYVQHEESAMHNKERVQNSGNDLLQAWEHVICLYTRCGVLKRFWPIMERLFIDFCDYLKKAPHSQKLRYEAWKLAKRCKLHKKSRHPEIRKMHLQYMPKWEKRIHWYKENRECYGIAGISLLSITYAQDTKTIRILGRIISVIKSNKS